MMNLYWKYCIVIASFSLLIVVTIDLLMADAAGSQVGGQVRGGGSQGNKGQGGGRKRHRHNRKSQQAKTGKGKRLTWKIL